MPRFFTLFLSAVALSCLTGMAWLMARPSPPDPQISKLEAENQELKGELARLRDQLKKQGTGKEAGAAAAKVPSPTNPAKSRLFTSNDPQAAAASSTSSLMDNMSASQIDMGYGKLMTLLNLNEQEKAHFKKLLLERDKHKNDAMRQMMGRTSEERKKMTDAMQAQQKTYDDAIKAFLNDAGDHETFKQWEDTRLERVQFERTGRALFDNSSEPLSDQQESWLMTAMASVRKAPSAPRPPLLSRVDAATATARITTYVQQTKEMHQTIQASAAGILSPAQLQMLSGYLAQNRDAMERTMRMIVRGETP